MNALAAAVRLLVAALLGVAHPAAGLLLVVTPIGRGARFDLPTGTRADHGVPIGRLRCAAPGGTWSDVHLEVFARGRVVVFRPASASPGRGARSAPRDRRPVFVSGTDHRPHGVVRFRPGHGLRLGDVFAVWGQPLTRERLCGFRSRAGVRVYVDGRRWGGPRRRSVCAGMPRSWSRSAGSFRRIGRTCSPTEGRRRRESQTRPHRRGDRLSRRRVQLQRRVSIGTRGRRRPRVPPERVLSGRRVRPGEPVTISFTVTTPSGAPLVHYRTGPGPHVGVHLIIVRDDLATIIHRHPPIGKNGLIRQRVVFPKPGPYHVLVDVYPATTRARLRELPALPDDSRRRCLPSDRAPRRITRR